MDKRPLIVVSICAVVILLLGSLSNVVGGQNAQAVGKKKVVLQNQVIDFILGGTMGQNGWYISDVTVTIIIRNHTWFRIDDGGWIEYTFPFTVGGDGMHLVEATSDFEHIYNVSFKIDQTPPEVHITVHRQGCRHVLVTVDAIENMSGIIIIEFYSDGALIGEDMDGPPFEFVFEVGLFGEHTVTVIVYDSAGNAGEASVTFPYSFSSWPTLGYHQFCRSLRTLFLLYQWLIGIEGIMR